MMLNIVGLDIEINRGNAAGLTFHFEGDDVPENGTIVQFQVKPAVNYGFITLIKEASVLDSCVDISFLPEDTAELNPGTYYWNACIQYTEGLEPWTVMRDWAEFRILP